MAQAAVGEAENNALSLCPTCKAPSGGESDWPDFCALFKLMAPNVSQHTQSFLLFVFKSPK